MARYTIHQLLVLAPQPFEPAIDFDGLLPAFNLGIWASGAGGQTFERMFEFYTTSPPSSPVIAQTEPSRSLSVSEANCIDAVVSVQATNPRPVSPSANNQASTTVQNPPAPSASVQTAQHAPLLANPPLAIVPPLDGSALHDRPMIADTCVRINAAPQNLARGTQLVNRKSPSTKYIRTYTASTTGSALEDRPELNRVSAPVHAPLSTLVHGGQPLVSTASMDTANYVAGTGQPQPSSIRYTDDHTLNHIVSLALDDTRQWPLPGVDHNDFTIHRPAVADVPTALAVGPSARSAQVSEKTKQASVDIYANAEISREHQRMIDEGYEALEQYTDATGAKSSRRVYYKAITYMPEYRQFSFEELHLQHISTGSTTASTSSTPHFSRSTWTVTPATIVVTALEALSISEVTSSPSELSSSTNEVAITTPELVVQPNQTSSVTLGPYPPTTLEAVPSGAVYDRMVTINITNSTGSHTFEVYQGLLKYYSDHFHSAIATFKAGGHSSITVENVEPRTFTMFTTWMNQRKFRLSQWKDDSELAWTTIFRMWAFADQYGVPMMQNYAINVYIDKSAEVCYQLRAKPTADDILYAYKISSSGSKLRKVIVDSINLTTPARKTILGRYGASKDFPSEFLFDLLQVVAQRPRGFVPWNQERFRNISRCKYHEHPRRIQCKN